MDTDEKPSSHGAVRAVLSLLSRSGPEVPPDMTDSPNDPPPQSNEASPSNEPSPSTVGDEPSPADIGNEPTELLPVIEPAPPKVVARAVLVYEPEPRQSRWLLVFTGVLVALTVGVVLGQAVAYKPVSRPAAATQVGSAPSYGTPPEASPGPSNQAVPAVGPPLTAPLGSAKTRLIEVTGASALLQIRSADLGEMLFSVAAIDGATMPSVVDTPSGPRLSLPDAAAASAGRTEVQLNSKVRWTIRLTGRSTAQEIDMSAGGLARIELIGGASRAVLQLPRPAGAVPLRVTGAVSDLHIRAGKGDPVRLRLGKGADTATLDGTTERNVKSGAALTSPGWRSAKNRYDVSASVRVGSVLVEHTP
jgi:hypothetical protein